MFNRHTYKYKKVGEQFVYNGVKYVVRKGIYDQTESVHCDSRCAFYDNKIECRKNIKITGDCQPRYRGDCIPVYFELYGQESK